MPGFFNFKKRQQLRQNARTLYGSVLERVRQPVFYVEQGVPDTVDGRFELIMLHAALVVRRLKAIGPEGQALAQALFDVMFRDMTLALREIGVGDLSIPHHIRRMMRGFRGRGLAYDSALDSALASGVADDLVMTLKRNLFGTVADSSPAALAWFSSYVRVVDADLFSQPDNSLIKGIVSFKDIPDEEKTAAGDQPRMVAQG